MGSCGIGRKLLRVSRWTVDIFTAIITLMCVQSFVFLTNFALISDFKLYAKCLAMLDHRALPLIGWLVGLHLGTLAPSPGPKSQETVPKSVK